MAPILYNGSSGPRASDDYPKLALIAYSAEAYREQNSFYPENLSELLNASQLDREQFSQLEGQIQLEAAPNELKMTYNDQVNGFN